MMSEKPASERLTALSTALSSKRRQLKELNDSEPIVYHEDHHDPSTNEIDRSVAVAVTFKPCSAQPDGSQERETKDKSPSSQVKNKKTNNNGKQLKQKAAGHQVEFACSIYTRDAKSPVYTESIRNGIRTGAKTRFAKGKSHSFGIDPTKFEQMINFRMPSALREERRKMQKIVDASQQLMRLAPNNQALHKAIIQHIQTLESGLEQQARRTARFRVIKRLVSKHRFTGLNGTGKKLHAPAVVPSAIAGTVLPAAQCETLPESLRTAFLLLRPLSPTDSSVPSS